MNDGQVVSWKRMWQGILWAVIGFGAGTGIAAPFVLSFDPRMRAIGGMMYGGVPLALVGLFHRLRRTTRP